MVSKGPLHTRGKNPLHPRYMLRERSFRACSALRLFCRERSEVIPQRTETPVYLPSVWLAVQFDTPKCNHDVPMAKFTIYSEQTRATLPCSRVPEPKVKLV
jgi:hypothetical protein